MKIWGLVAAVLVLSQTVTAQHDHALATSKAASLLAGMGDHPISTGSPEAQRFFDQGLTLVFGFNHDEAVRSFEQAAKLDQQSPMPW